MKYKISVKIKLPVHVGIWCDHVESAKHSIELTPDIWKPQAHLNAARLP